MGLFKKHNAGERRRSCATMTLTIWATLCHRLSIKGLMIASMEKHSWSGITSTANG